MKHVFECGIVGESNDEVGDTFLAKMVATERDSRLPHGKLPDDFTIDIPDCYYCWGNQVASATIHMKMEALMKHMIDCGYETLRWRDNDRWCDCVRFRRVPV